MNNVKLLLKYFSPYKWSAVRNILYNILSALFALLSYTLAIPFLKILFDTVEPAAHPGKFEATASYISDFSKYYLSAFIDAHGKGGALLFFQERIYIPGK
jgi:hypothetical protein